MSKPDVFESEVVLPDSELTKTLIGLTRTMRRSAIEARPPTPVGSI